MEQISWAHLLLHLGQLSLQLRYLALQLLLSVLPPLFTLCNGCIHFYPELRSEAIFTLHPGDANQSENGVTISLKMNIYHFLLFLSLIFAQSRA